jgi:hypothetical protein
MNIDYKSVLMGVAAGYLFREAIGQAFGSTEEKEKKEAAALGALHMGALHMGAIQENPYGAIQMNPNHMGAIQMGAIHTNPHSAFARTQAFPRGARPPWGYGAVHMGALARR